VAEPELQGRVAEGFDKVARAFEQNFAEDLEVGASFAVVCEGEAVVDIWGGWADRAGTRPWGADTLVNVYSTTKGMTALCVAILVDRGRIDYETPMAACWTEFAEGGKDELTVGQVLSHQGGLSGLRETIVARDYVDWEKMVGLLAAQEPFFPPGRSGYHAITFGFLAGELVRRVDGRSLGTFFAEEIARPLGADVWIGLPESEDGRAAEILKPRRAPDQALPSNPFATAALSNPVLDAEVPNERWYRAAEIPAANGQTNARGLAQVYGLLANGGELSGVELMSPNTIALATRERISNEDLVLEIPMRWAAGYLLNDGVVYGPGELTFGHSGWGGSFACADPIAGIGIAYAMNQMYPNLQGDERSQRLLAAVYECL